MPPELWYLQDNDGEDEDDEVRAFSRSNSSVSLPTCSDTDEEHTVKTVRYFAFRSIPIASFNLIYFIPWLGEPILRDFSIDRQMLVKVRM